MKKTTIAIALLSAVLTITNVSCKKEAGPQGAKGETGANGINGNANVKSKTEGTSAWQYSAPAFHTTISFAAITQDILDNGAVMVYVKTGTSSYSQLPITFYPSTTYSKSYEVVTGLGQVTVFITDSDLTQPGNPGFVTFKIVAIDGDAYRLHKNVNYENYSEVVSTFGL